MTTTSTPRKESSARKVAANRANGRKSKGPVTKAGKEKTRKNALKHGLFTKALPEEEHPFLVDREEYHRLIDPRTQFETTLVEYRPHLQPAPDHAERVRGRRIAWVGSGIPGLPAQQGCSARISRAGRYSRPLNAS